MNFILSTITYPVVSNATSPKALPGHTLTYFISDSLIVHPVCAPVLKDFTSYYTQSVGTKDCSVFKQPRLRIIQCCVFSSSRIVCHRLLASILPHHRFRLARHGSKSVYRAIFICDENMAPLPTFRILGCHGRPFLTRLKLLSFAEWLGETVAWKMALENAGISHQD